MFLKKVLSVVNYLGALCLLLLAYLGGILFYPFLYPFRNVSWIRNNYPGWWWFDDEDGNYGAEYWRKAKGITKKNFWVAYRWAGLRNPMWNAHTKIRPGSGEEILLYGVGKLTRDGKEVNIMNIAIINYEDSEGRYQGNAGDYFSIYFSYLGWAFIWFYKNEKLHWRFSLAKRIYKRRWIQFQFGSFHRYIFKIKSSVNKGM